MSYLSAWRWVEAINNALYAPAVATKVGGRKGGRAVLTPVGMQILGLYRAIEARVQTATVAQRDALESLARSESTRARNSR
jgi:molybdate transport system regulatory protein